MGSKRPNLKLSKGDLKLNSSFSQAQSQFSTFSKFVDPSGKLNFNGKAVLHSDGVDFSNGNSYKINMAELKVLQTLGKGQYGIVQKVFHEPTNVTMAMKEIRLELDQAKLNQIVMELEVLHKSHNPYIVEFYGAFFIESCVYYCMEYMDGCSLDLACWKGTPEKELSYITRSIVEGLSFLKDELSIIHRDVKPTNILINTKGEVKLCDFGVSGQLVMSMAKTHIGCQSYMAPERITHSSSSYTVQSDVFSLGLSILEIATGKYPYSSDKFDSVFVILNEIVMGEAPKLPDTYSDIAQDFVAQCLQKSPEKRPTYAELLEHPFLAQPSAKGEGIDMVSWVGEALKDPKPIPSHPTA
ncbi:MAP kinase [Conidiobolus coronatus NRRL 28638]|uniref:mitogen-activated protein kinase kinase n=1 Tax=Conidiobolus coronatus (strain ATCC 28846 / CBS 209.66 / NRRL 28638) TaxID=796925 RepID=A0A137P8K5_CONC2|nr:MAP kinase [Conidiobolus coronatus NRRL 28638]|eukprot:KXN71284.1 MAP kinase [Conidiobolus coronatus NRRL 28638]